MLKKTDNRFSTVLLKRLCIFSGEDYQVMKESDQGLIVRFAVIGLFVAFIFLLCFYSTYFAFTQILDDSIGSIMVGLFFALMITNIYLLLLYTLSKNSFPANNTIIGKVASRGVRLLFVSFIALIISKPIEVRLYENILDKEVREYKAGAVEKFTKTTDTLHEREVANMRYLISHSQALNSTNTTELVDFYNAQIRQKEKQRDKAIETATLKIWTANFFLQKVVFLVKNHSESWFITLLCILIFLTPATLKNLLGTKASYNQLKKDIELRLVLEEYEIFKKNYTSIFENKFGLKFTWRERFADPPFNTIPIHTSIDYRTQEDLISQLYDGRK